MVSNSSISHELKPGELFCERYRIRKRIADGGMASIYLAVDAVSGLNVAIKVLFYHFLESPVIRTRFLDEGRIQAMLRHPNIVHVYRVLSKPILCFVMEFVDGITLEEHLQQRGPLREREILEIILPVMSAVGFAHSKGIIHRDIKPSNILIKPNEGFLEPKVMDFGVAKVTTGRDLTAAGTTVGTLHYMSPEQIVGSRTIDGRADIYSLGVTLYKLCTGDVPFNASTEFALMMAQVEATPLAPRAIRPELSQGMEDIILRALEKEPARRFQSIKEFTSALMGLSDRTQFDTDTRPIPAELLKFAMMADEVATDRTAEITFEPIEALEERAYARDAFAPSVTVEIDETTDMMNPRMEMILEQDARNRTRRASYPPSVQQESTEESKMEQVSTLPHTSKVDPLNFDTWEAKRPETLTRTVEDDVFREENTEEKPTLLWNVSEAKQNLDTLAQPTRQQPPEKSHQKAEKASRGVVALDAGADSHEVTGLSMSQQDLKAALARAKARNKPPIRGLFEYEAPVSSPSQKPEPRQNIAKPGPSRPSLENQERAPSKPKKIEESTRPDRPSANIPKPRASSAPPHESTQPPWMAKQPQPQSPIATERRLPDKEGISQGVWLFTLVIIGAVLLIILSVLIIARLRGG